MQTYSCKEKNIQTEYAYSAEMELELLRRLPPPIVLTSYAKRVLRKVAGLLRLNIFECFLLAWILQRSRYDFASLGVGLLEINQFDEQRERQLFLYLLLNAYCVKCYVNGHEQLQLDSNIVQIVPNFAGIYQRWRPDYSIKDVPLNELNSSFNEWMAPGKHLKTDYNHMVSRILDLSKSYNVGGNEQEAVRNKNQKQEVQQDPQEKPQSNIDALLNMEPIQIIPLPEIEEPEDQIYRTNKNWEDHQSNQLDIEGRNSRNMGLGEMTFNDLGESRFMQHGPTNFNTSLISDMSSKGGSRYRNDKSNKIRPTRSFDKER